MKLYRHDMGRHGVVVITADGPGHARMQVIGLQRGVHKPDVVKQTQIKRRVHALGQAARDYVHSGFPLDALPSVPFNKEK